MNMRFNLPCIFNASYDNYNSISVLALKYIKKRIDVSISPICDIEIHFTLKTLHLNAVEYDSKAVHLKHHRFYN